MYLPSSLFLYYCIEMKISEKMGHLYLTPKVFATGKCDPRLYKKYRSCLCQYSQGESPRSFHDKEDTNVDGDDNITATNNGATVPFI
jgi:hypothetical protein